MSVIEIKLSGPLFTGQLPAIVHAFGSEMVDEVGAQSYAEVMGYLNAQIRHPTPYYETQVVYERTSESGGHVHDRGIIYGSWLEGTSSRNQSTRFKGYASFRKGFQAMLPKIDGLALSVLARYIGKMNGS